MKSALTISFVLFSLFQITTAQTVTYQYDDLNRLTQADYGNGTVIQYSYDKLGNRTQYVITGSATAPDLQPTALSVNNSTVSPGGQVLLTYSLNNNGQISAGQNVARFYINTSTSLPGATQLDNRNFSSVAGSSSTQYTQLLTIPAGTSAGVKYLLIDVDADDQVAESNENNNLASISITVQACPVITVSFPVVTNETCEEGNGSIQAQGAGGAAPYSYVWNTVPPQSTATVSNLIAGNYTVSVTDADGCVTSANRSIINSGTDPVSSFTAATAGLTANFTSTATGATSWLWDFGDNSTSTMQNASHTYSAGGSYLVCLQVTNSCDTDNSCQTVTINAAEYVTIESAPGVELLRKQTPGDDPDFIQIVDLSAGAYIEFDHGDITSGAGTGNPFFTREDIDDVWTEKTGQFPNVFSVTNGQFFNAAQSPAATLAFPVKQGGNMVSDGYGNTSEFVGEKEFLGLWANLANVSPYNDDPASVANSPALHGIVGLDKDANKSPTSHTGRTFAGVLDADNDGIYEKVLIFTSKTATQAYAAQQLNDMGVPFDKIVMLDGGGSTQMKCNGTDYVSATRLVPQYLVVYSSTSSVNDDCAGATPISCGETVSGTTSNATVDQTIVFSENFNQCYPPGGWQAVAVDTAGNTVTTTVGSCNAAVMFSFNCSSGFPGGSNPASGFSGCQAVLNDNGAGAPFVGTLYLTSPEINLSAGGGNLFFDWQNVVAGTAGILSAQVWNGSTWVTLLSRTTTSAGSASLSLASYNNSDFKVRFSYNDELAHAMGAAIDNVVVTDQSGLASCGVDINTPGVWYSFTGDGNIVTLSTCGQTSYDTRISVYSGNCNNLVCETGNEDGEGCLVTGSNNPFATKLSLATTPGTAYYVLVHGWPNATGTFDLSMDCSPPLPNDACANAVALTVHPEGNCPSSATAGTTLGATSDGSVSCGGNIFNTQNNGVWYSFTAPASGMVSMQVNEISGNHKAIVYDACNGNEILCTTEPNEVILGGLTPGSQYKILVWALSGGEGDFSICLSEISCSATIEGDATTLFASNNGHTGNMFDVTNTLGCPIVLSGFDVNLINNVTTDIQIWYTTTATSYVGLETSASDWTMLGSASVTSAGQNAATYVSVGGLELQPGETKGIYVAAQTNNVLRYTNGDGTNQHFTDGVLSIDLGVGKGYPNFGLTYSPRVWNGTIYYNNSEVLGCASLSSPAQGETGVSVDADLYWVQSPSATGYKLTMGTTSGGTDILNNYDVGNVTTYGLSGQLPSNTTIYVTITPYNAGGDATGCSEGWFVTEDLSALQVSFLSYNSLEISYPENIDINTVNAANLIIIGEETGARAGIYAVTDNVITFTPDVSFNAGEQLFITSTSAIKNTSGTAMPKWNWTKYAPVNNPTAGIFSELSTGITLPAAATAYSMQHSTADFNRDGLVDIIVRYHASYGGSTNILIYFQKPDGTFAAPATYTYSSSHSNLTGTPDLNNDGYPDIVVTHNVPSRVHVRLNNGDGTFSGATVYTVNNYSNGAIFGDIDNDGDLDIISSTGVSSISLNSFDILKNNGDGTFQPKVSVNTSTFGRKGILGDIDNDGDTDFIYTSTNNFGSSPYFRVYENDGTGTFSLHHSEANTDLKYAQYAINMDGGGNLDLVSSVSTGEIHFGNGTLNATLTNPSVFSNEYVNYVMGDVDGNGTMDVFSSMTYNGTDWTSYPHRVFFNDGTGNMSMATGSFDMHSRPASKMTDIDNDGDLDMLYVKDGTDDLYIALNNDLCEENLIITQTPILAGDYLASNSIISMGKVATGSSVIFDAKNNVLLSPDFEVEQGAVFEALTGDGCPPTWSCGDILSYGGQDYNTVQIGNQCWLAENLNIGKMINGSANQTDNSTIEKYCYNDDPAYCDTYGALYQWDEMMQYTTVESTQGVCPIGWHLPSDSEFKTMESHLGMTQAQRDAIDFRGTNEGSKIAGNAPLWTDGALDTNANFGATGFDGLPGGLRNSNGAFSNIPNFTYFWSSSENSAFAWARYLGYSSSKLGRYYYNQNLGFSVRCVKD